MSDNPAIVKLLLDANAIATTSNHVFHCWGVFSITAVLFPIPFAPFPGSGHCVSVRLPVGRTDRHRCTGQLRGVKTRRSRCSWSRARPVSGQSTRSPLLCFLLSTPRQLPCPGRTPTSGLRFSSLHPRSADGNGIGWRRRTRPHQACHQAISDLPPAKLTPRLQ